MTSDALTFDSMGAMYQIGERDRPMRVLGSGLTEGGLKFLAQTTKRLPALPAEAQSKAAHHVATFSMDKHHEHFSAKPATATSGLEVYSGSHGYSHGHHRQWLPGRHYPQRHMGKTGTPMKHEQVMFMESANGQSNATMGSIPSICFSIGEVSLYCQFRSSRKPPSKCLLGLPFACLGFD